MVLQLLLAGGLEALDEERVDAHVTVTRVRAPPAVVPARVRLHECMVAWVVAHRQAREHTVPIVLGRAAGVDVAKRC